jgi:hypothetical protein
MSFLHFIGPVLEDKWDGNQVKL